MIPSEGFEGGAWDTNPATATITGSTTFTYTFEAFSYHNFCLLRMNDKLVPALKGYPRAEEASHVLVYGYIDQDKGIMLDVIAGCREDGDGYQLFKTSTDIHSMVGADLPCLRSGTDCSGDLTDALIGAVEHAGQVAGDTVNENFLQPVRDAGPQSIQERTSFVPTPIREF